DPEAARLRLARRISQIEEQLDLYTRELDELKASPLWQLKAIVDEAAGRGKDLVADMVRRLKRDIIAARNRLDAMRWNPCWKTLQVAEPPVPPTRLQRREPPAQRIDTNHDAHPRQVHHRQC